MQIKQSTQLKNMLAPLKAPGVNIVSSVDGIIIAGAAVGILIRREAKNRTHVTALSSNVLVKSKEEDFPSLGAALDYCAKLIGLDSKIKSLKEV